MSMVRLHGRNVLTQNADANMPTLRGNGGVIILYTLSVVNAELSLWMDDEERRNGGIRRVPFQVSVVPCPVAS